MIYQKRFGHKSSKLISTASHTQHSNAALRASRRRVLHRVIEHSLCTTSALLNPSRGLSGSIFTSPLWRLWHFFLLETVRMKWIISFRTALAALLKVGLSTRSGERTGLRPCCAPAPLLRTRLWWASEGFRATCRSGPHCPSTPPAAQNCTDSWPRGVEE